MKTTKAPLILLFAFFLSLTHNSAQACSMYKVSASGKTMVGCNHDAWLTTSKIWFENAKDKTGYGAGFTGAREVSRNRTTPQSGMNTAGLAFSRLSSIYPIQDNPFKDRLPITDEAEYLSNILHHCANIQEVKNYINRYDHSYFLHDVFIYIDSMGDYLIVEPYKLIEGNDPSYVLANFCPSITSKEQARKVERFRQGEDFIKNKEINTSLAYCTALSDTMHVCRARLGDGTLLTSIWDTKDKSVNLFFYHNYDTTVHFSLSDELAKGDHTLNVPELFPINSEFEKLAAFKTPSNNLQIRISLIGLAALLLLCSLIFALAKAYNQTAKNISLPSILGIIGLNFILVFYLFVLITNMEAFYFDVPYKHYGSALISAASYIPFLFLLFLGPLLFYTVKKLRSTETQNWIKVTLASNNAVYLLLLFGFTYWGLFSFWN
ncbi:MAG: hypothetical protein EP332_01965 [Bacteroidetes bacterium]|nr:MAG: hypothetical protein EP332_01965 [Bacteroidota bacterium]